MQKVVIANGTTEIYSHGWSPRFLLVKQWVKSCGGSRVDYLFLSQEVNINIKNYINPFLRLCPECCDPLMQKVVIANGTTEIYAHG
jgi:hypothetical protein